MNRQRLRKLIIAYNILKFYYLSYKYIKNRRSKKRRWWVKPMFQKRAKLGFFETTFTHIKNNNEELFFKYTRMSRLQYDLLLSLVEKNLTKCSIRKPITAECRLALTLVYLSQGVSKNYIARSFRIGVSTVRQIIIEVCELLWKLLSPVYMTPLDTIDWINITYDFQNKWQMPNCIGSIDGKHVQIKCPPKTGSQYKRHFNILMMGICDANYLFTAIDVGAYGSQSDWGIFRNSAFGQKILNNDLNVLPPQSLANSDKVTPLYFVAGNAFPLKTNLMRPYPGLLLEPRKDNFNQRLSMARRVIENAFGILITRWRILTTSIEFHPENAKKVILACVILHNFIKITSIFYNCNTYNPFNYTDSYDEYGNLILGLWREDNVRLESIGHLGGSNNSTREALLVRETLADYFINEGTVIQNRNNNN